ncbi:MAG: VOC family protein [Dysgonamonadaceae bacterium]
MKLKVHLVFAGNCEEALTFYANTLDGSIDFIFRKKEGKNVEVADPEAEKISHMVIKTPDFEIAGEDADVNHKITVGDNNKLVLVFPEVEKCRLVFDKFAQNGTVTMPFEKTFFCEGMGEVTDKYGISWIIMVTDEGYEG